MSGFVKLASSILDSSLMEESLHVRWCWVCLLAMSNPVGFVRGTPVVLARRANVSLEQAEEAISVLCDVDPNSFTTENEGRRLIQRAGGWEIVNYLAYREKRDEDERRKQNREAQQRRRQHMSASVSTRQPASAKVSQGQPRSAQAEAEAEADISLAPLEPKKPRKEPLSKEEGEFLDWWISELSRHFDPCPLVRPLSKTDVLAIHKLRPQACGHPWETTRRALAWALTDPHWRRVVAAPRAIPHNLPYLLAGAQNEEHPIATKGGIGLTPTSRQARIRERVQHLQLEVPFIADPAWSQAKLQAEERAHDRALRERAEKEVG